MGVLNLQANQVTFPNRYLKFSFGSILNDQNKLKRPFNLKINFSFLFSKVHEERVLKQQREYENEIKLLNETIQRLENHLSEQTRLVTQVILISLNK